MPFRVGAEASTLRLVVLRWRPFLFFKLCLSRYFELCRLVSRLQIQHWLKIPTKVPNAKGKWPGASRSPGTAWPLTPEDLLQELSERRSPDEHAMRAGHDGIAVADV